MNALTQNTKITSTDINTLISECNGKLNLSGGTLSGRLDFSQSECGGGYIYPSNNTFYVGGRGQDGRDASFIRFYGLDSDSPGSFAIHTRKTNGDWGCGLFGNNEGNLWWNDNKVLTSAGGDLYNTLKCDGVFVRTRNITSDLYMSAHPSRNVAEVPGIIIRGIDGGYLPGHVQIVATTRHEDGSSEPYTVFGFSPTGELYAGGDRILTTNFTDIYSPLVCHYQENAVDGYTHTQISGTMAMNDRWAINTTSTANDAGMVEIATYDNGNEPICATQYDLYPAEGGTTVRRAYILDGYGNTSFPGQLYVHGNYIGFGNGTGFWIA